MAKMLLDFELYPHAPMKIMYGYTGKGTAIMGDRTIELPSSTWNPAVTFWIKKSLMKDVNFPKNFRVTIEWDESEI